MQGIQVASLFGVLDLKDNLTPGLQKAESGLHNLGGKVSGVGDKMTSFGRTFAPISLALGAMGAAGIKTASDFDGAMAEISARTGVVGEDLEAVRQFALKMGADTAFSAQEAAAGLLELLSSGQSVEEAMQTLPTVLDMAAASGEALGFSADALTDIMAAFGLEIEDATDVANSLARAAGASSADIASLALAFGNVGPVAKQFGMDVNQTAATLALLAENGIKGAEAGTALKSMLLNMTRDTEEVAGAWNELGTSFYDAAGNARDLDKVIADIKIGLEGMPIERQNARYLEALPEPIALAVADLSFISLALILPVIGRILGPEGQAITLVKPQFEAGKEAVGKGGVVRDPATHRAVLAAPRADRHRGSSPGLLQRPVRHLDRLRVGNGLRRGCRRPVRTHRLPPDLRRRDHGDSAARCTTAELRHLGLGRLRRHGRFR